LHTAIPDRQPDKTLLHLVGSEWRMIGVLHVGIEALADASGRTFPALPGGPARRDPGCGLINWLCSADLVEGCGS
jgi:hypothetical protein